MVWFSIISFRCWNYLFEMLFNLYSFALKVLSLNSFVFNAASQIKGKDHFLLGRYSVRFYKLYTHLDTYPRQQMCSSFKLDSCEIFEHCGIKFSISESRKLKLEDRVCPAFRTSIKATLLGCLCRRFRNRKQICVPASVLLCECATASKQPGNAIPAQASSRIWAHVSLAEVTLALARCAWIMCTTCRNAVRKMY